MFDYRNFETEMAFITGNTELSKYEVKCGS